MSITRQAFDEAIQRGHGWVGVEHLLLALLSQPSTATDVLAESGVTYQRLSDFYSGRELSPKYEPSQGLSGPNPDGLLVRGRAQGLSLAAGLDMPTPEHWLLAMAYSPKGMLFPALLDSFDVSAETLVRALAARGVDVPAVDLPYRGD